ncbi:transcriptional regulator [Prosthecochloris sp. N3]|uniref:Transcriptional regulator n=1 Tax=Prosthecochloris ethylica TaxID=2743976 RepID=A0ABR9XNF2_9CHLB|nr:MULTISPECIES: transcriptional regulator [Prosthecochloris]MBF0585680.1 transcriptional regulator [Prosthecochloris ethylica]MBF0635590.1 transcriptional regulator [Prosthecochloris ethylica]NUK46889.1 transcriptional regulator [Prosthecochloris ethylica]RNA65388.1 transcriptional regulator [Prosthecochloris sp. ZM_2]
MKHCPVTGLQITERPHWKSPHSDRHYTTHMQRIGEDIILTYYSSAGNVIIEYMDRELFQTVLDESDLAEQPVYLLRDMSNVCSVTYAYKKNLTQLLYQWQPNFRCIIFYNVKPEFLTTVETFAAIVNDNTTVLVVNGYEEAMNAVSTLKSGEEIREEFEDDEDELYTQHKRDFLAATARIGWLNMLNQPLPLPEEDDYLYPFFKAIESLQQDLQEKEKGARQELNEHDRECEQKLAQQTIQLNAQLEMNNRLKKMFERERSMLKSRIASQDMELTRISTAITEKAAALEELYNTILSLDIDTRTRQQMTETCRRLIKTEVIEKKLNTELTSTDSEFLSKLQKTHPNLNQRDLRIGLLIKLNYDTREIARTMGISTRGLESIRYRMHKKMGLSKHQSIKNYLVTLSTK